MDNNKIIKSVLNYHPEMFENFEDKTVSYLNRALFYNGAKNRLNKSGFDIFKNIFEYKEIKLKDTQILTTKHYLCLAKKLSYPYFLSENPSERIPNSSKARKIIYLFDTEQAFLLQLLNGDLDLFIEKI